MNTEWYLRGLCRTAMFLVGAVVAMVGLVLHSWVWSIWLVMCLAFAVLYAGTMLWELRPHRRPTQFIALD